MRTRLDGYDDDHVIAQGAAAFVESVAVLRWLADKAGDPGTRDRLRRLATDLTTEARAPDLAAAQRAAGRKCP